METENKHFYERVAETYAHLAEGEPDRFRRLNGERPIEDLQEEIRADVRALLDRRS
jgi:thymidylate kinase